MKVLHYTLLSFFALSLFSSCKKNGNDNPTNPVAPFGKLQVSFSNEVNNQPIAIGPLSYTNGAGNDYSIDMLKYYVTNFTLVKADGTEKNFKNYELIDADKPESLSFTLDSVASADYTAVKFYLGIDSLRNHSGAQDGDLDPMHGMIWTWNTGYIFFKHEGSFKDNAGSIRPLAFHFATDKALTSVSVPITKLTVAGNTRKLFLRLNMNKLYNAPNQMDFNQDNNRMSGALDGLWISAMSANFAAAFEHVKSE